MNAIKRLTRAQAILVTLVTLIALAVGSYLVPALVFAARGLLGG